MQVKTSHRAFFSGLIIDWAHYRRIPSLKEYVFVDQKTKKIEVYRRFERNRWEFSEFGSGEDAIILEAKISVDAVYHDAMTPG